MTHKTTFRIPGQLKRKLEASLESLTPREAARLRLIYTYEAFRKGEGREVYPPIQELDDAWKKRVEKARVKGDLKEVEKYKAYHFLAILAEKATEAATTFLLALIVDAVPAIRNLQTLLMIESFSTVMTTIVETFDEGVPWPVAPDVYDRVVKWIEDDMLLDVDEGVNEVFENWLHENFTLLEVPAAFVKANADPDEGETEAIRRQWVAAEGKDKVLREYFKGSPDLLDEWLQMGGYADVSQVDYDAKWEEIREAFYGMIQAGQLVACDAVFMSGAAEEAIPLVDGKLPVWAVLRYVWASWLYDNQCQATQVPIPTPGTVHGRHPVSRWRDGSAVEGEALVALVVALVEDCRSRPWGMGIKPSSDIDFPRLAAFLTEDVYTTIAQAAPDLGLVDFEVVKTSERRPRELEAMTAVTIGSLKRVDARFDDWGDFYRSQFYPTTDHERRAKTLAFVFELLQRAQGVKRNLGAVFLRDDLSLDALFPEDFVTGLRRDFKAIGEGFRGLEEWRIAFKRLSDDYFGRLPLVHSALTKIEQNFESELTSAEETLDRWLKQFPPRYYDVSSLRLTKPAPREETVKQLVDIVLRQTRYVTGFDEADLDFGPDPLTKRGKA